MKHRPIGIGIQGLADTLVLLKIPFDSDEAVQFNADMMETIYYGCVKASKDIAKNRHEKMKLLVDAKVKVPEFYDNTFTLQDKDLNKLYHELIPCKYEIERTTNYFGTYSSYNGSPFSKGILQFDMWNVIPKQKERWDELKKEIALYGVRNSQLTALMPTATTSQILGNNECFEFFTNNIYTRRTLAGDFPLVNEYLVNDLITFGLWSSDMKDLILSYNGSIAEINVIPDFIKKLYPTIWEIKQSWVLKQAVARGPFVDQTQSMNIFMAVPDYQKLYSSHMWSWKNGLKTGIYYLRSKPAQDAIKFTVDPNIQKMNQKIEPNTTNNNTKERRFKKPEDTETCESCSA
jgi:ribonucleotide reductase alpha subunit